MDADGLSENGCKKASNEKELRSLLEKHGFRNITVHKTATRFVYNSLQNVTAKEISVFCRQMSVVFFSNITIMEGVSLLAEQTESKQLRLCLEELVQHMNGGLTFAEALGMYHNIFPKYLINMIAIGETSGTLDSVFVRLADYYEKEHKNSRKLRQAITYPAILAVLMFGIILLLTLKIIPMFEDILESMAGEMPDITKVIFAISSFISQQIFIIAGMITAIVIFAVFVSRTEKRRRLFDRIKLHAPISRYVVTRLITARFAKSLSILLKSGVQLLNALDEVKTLIDNKAVRVKYDAAVEKVKSGSELSSALAEVGVFPKLFLKMLIIGQTTGKLDEMLDKSSAIFDDESDEAISRITVLVEPILIIALSVIVGVILISVMMPMTAIMNSIK